MLRASLAVLLVCTVVVSAWEQPAFCKDNECPEYSVVESNDDYEIREYAPTKWVVTSYRATNFWKRFWSMNGAFMRLFKYIQGENVDDVKIPMTAPVRTTVWNCEETGCDDETHVMGFYVPKAQSEDVPEPLSSKVRVIEVPAKRYYVRSFGGYAMERKFDNELEALISAIGDEDAYNSGYHVTSGYNSPMEMTDRHNEVMLEVADQE